MEDYIIKEEYMLLRYGDNDFWTCAEFVAESLRYGKVYLDRQTKESLRLYCKALFDLGVKRQALANQFFLSSSSDYNKTVSIVREMEYYNNIEIRFYNSKDEISNDYDNMENLLFNLRTKKWELL